MSHTPEKRCAKYNEEEIRRMKKTGIVRQIDQLGRFVIPKEIRKMYDINDFDELEIYTEDDMIVIKKYQPSCIFCGSSDFIIEFRGKRVCRKCIGELIDKD